MPFDRFPGALCRLGNGCAGGKHARSITHQAKRTPVLYVHAKGSILRATVRPTSGVREGGLHDTADDVGREARRATGC
ncbi:MAG: hypothetical protein QOF33_881 [Thermomicrobiales bacterium]|jgi:hypothetical protein|nr:hypothetical protein [Thermomicrobiales bacterium]